MNSTSVQIQICRSIDDADVYEHAHRNTQGNMCQLMQMNQTY